MQGLTSPALAGVKERSMKMDGEILFNDLCRLAHPLQCTVCGKPAYAAVVVLVRYKHTEASITPLCGDCAMRVRMENGGAWTEALVQEKSRRSRIAT